MSKGDESGEGSFWTIFWLIFVSCVFYSCYVIIPFFYNFYELQNLMQAQANKAKELSDDKIRQVIFEKISELKIPLKTPDAIRIERYGRNIQISASYDQEFYVDLRDYGIYDIYVFHFNPFVKQDIPDLPSFP